jgi:hypothetical protein
VGELAGDGTPPPAGGEKLGKQQIGTKKQQWWLGVAIFFCWGLAGVSQEERGLGLVVRGVAKNGGEHGLASLYIVRETVCRRSIEELWSEREAKGRKQASG